MKNGFSLVELSIALIIIGLLVGGSMGGATLIKQAKIKNAVSISKSSPVWEILGDDGYGAVLWFDALDEESIIKTNNVVSEWRSRVKSVRAIQATSIKQPLYSREGLSGTFPAIDFDGSDDYLSMNPTLIEGKSAYTIAAVWQADVIKTQVVWEQNMSTAVGNRRGALLLVGSNYGFNGASNDAHSMRSYQANQVNATVLVNNAGAISLFHNNDAKITASVSNPSALNLGVEVSAIGSRRLTSGEYFNGKISEVIVFDTALSDDDASLIAKYLTNKYSIK